MAMNHYSSTRRLPPALASGAMALLLRDSPLP